MSVSGLGTDVVLADRFRRFLKNEKTAILDRLFTPGEKEYAFAKRDPAPHLAARFAAKEAFLKSLGTGLRDGLSWQDIEVVRDLLGKPSLHLTGKAAEIVRERKISEIHLSYSHDGDYAMATVILEGS